MARRSRTVVVPATAPPADAAVPAGTPTRIAGRLRTTRQGASVDALLNSSEVFRTAQDLHAELRARGDSVGLTTVYRHLGVLANAGRVDVVHRPDGEAQYRACGTGVANTAGIASHARHHHHVVCRVCGRAEEVEGPEVETWADRVARDAGFTDVTHTLEVFGLCPEHSAPAPTQRRSIRGLTSPKATRR